MSTEMEVALICGGMVAGVAVLTIIVVAIKNIGHYKSGETKDGIKMMVIALIVIGAFLGIWAGTQGIIGKSGGDTTKKQNDSVAWSYAKSYVKSELKSPSEAVFCSYYDATITYDKNTGVYTIKGYVDAPNSFGATIRTKFTVNLELTGDYYKNASASYY